MVENPRDIIHIVLRNNILFCEVCVVQHTYHETENIAVQRAVLTVQWYRTMEHGTLTV